jgi:hypothetical protein
MNITATSMVMISGIVAILVAKPVKRNTEQITSVKTVRPKESSALMPNTGGNCTGAPENSIINLGMPCVNINTAIPTLANSRAMPVVFDVLLILNNFFMF